MPAPRFITSDAQIGAEGVYIRSVTPSSAVEGVQNNVVGIAGRCVRGPVGVAVEITSPQRFLDVFGGRDYGAGGAYIGEIHKALLNKPFGDLVIVRAAAAAATTAEADFVDDVATPVLNVAAANPGVWGDDLTVSIEDATDGDANHFNIVVTYGGKTVTYRNLDISAGDNLLEVIGEDDANLIVATKLADGRPVNVADAALDDTAGADGVLADADFTAANGPLDILAGYTGVGVVFVAGQSTAAVKTQLNVLSAASNDRLFLCCPDSAAITETVAKTEVATLRTTNGRLAYCFDHYKTLDRATASLITVEPHALMASILSQTDADVHPGVADNRQFAAGVRALTFESLDYDGLRAAGICALGRHRKGGFVFVSGVTTSTERPEIAERRMRDFLIGGIADRTDADVKRPNTQDRRDGRRGAVAPWLTNLAESGRYVDQLADGTPAFVYDTEILNTPDARAEGIQKDLGRIRLVAFGLFIVIYEETGTGVRISEGN